MIKLPVLGYVLLRGWDEGYVIPNFGIAVHPQFRGQGLGCLLMEYLRVAARRRGAQKIRLKVYKENGAAVRLYESMGYRFEPQLESGQLVGFLSL